MDDLPINRASNPFKNQGYMLRRGGGGKFSAAKVPIFGTLGTGYKIGKFLGKNFFKLLGMKMKKKYKYG